MAKDKDEKKGEVTVDDFNALLADLEIKSDVIGELRKEINRMGPVVDDLRVTLAAMAPSRSEIPPEVLSKIRPDIAYAAALQGCLIGLIQVSGPSVSSNTWKSYAEKAVEMAETTFKLILERAK